MPVLFSTIKYPYWIWTQRIRGETLLWSEIYETALPYCTPNLRPRLTPLPSRPTRFRFDTLAHAKRWRHSCTNPNTYIVLNVLNVILLENSRIRFPSAARSGRLTGACVDIEERVQGVHVRISAQLGLDRFRMCAMTANPSNNCVNLYGLTQEI
jgi:hypothetical protein